MKTKLDVQQRVIAFLHEKRWSLRKLALTMGLSPSTLARMMEDNPSYRGEADAWLQLARYRDLGLDEAEVLAAVGLGPKPPRQPNAGADGGRAGFYHESSRPCPAPAVRTAVRGRSLQLPNAPRAAPDGGWAGR